MVRRHVEYTNIRRGSDVLGRWVQLVPRFVKVYPNDYRRVIEAQSRLATKGLPEQDAVKAAFEENAHDLARVGGT